MYKMCENTGEYTMYIYIIFKSLWEELRINCRIFLCIYTMIFRIYITVFTGTGRIIILKAIIEKVRLWLKNKDIEQAAVILGAALLCLILIACISIGIHSNMQKKYAAAALETQEEAYRCMIEMTQLFARVEEPNVDVQNKLIPRLKEKYAAVLALNETLVKGFGQKYAVLSTEQVAELDAAFAEYDEAYRQGMATGLAQDDMAVCIAGVQSLIDEHYKPSEDEVIGSMFVSTTHVPG